MSTTGFCCWKAYEGGDFFVCVENYYKIFVDASVCRGVLNIYQDKSVYNDINQIVALRTLISHNVDERSANDYEVKDLDEWFVSTLGKLRPESEYDYGKLVNKLQESAEEYVSVLERYIDEFINEEQKDDIVSAWEKLIIEYYKRKNSEKIIEGQIRTAYCAQTGYDIHSKREIAEWVKKIIRKYGLLADTIEMFLNNSCTESLKHQYDDAIFKYQEIDSVSLNQLLKYYNLTDEEQLTLFNYYYFYVKQMPQKIQQKVDEHSRTSLLPQEIIQEIIEEDLRNTE